MEKYTDLSTKLGRGSCGNVMLVQRKSDMKFLAMKVIELATTEAAKNAENESNFLEKLQHPNIVQFYETFVQKECLYLVMEYCEQGDLQKKVKEAKANKEYLSEEQVLGWFTQACLAVKQLHDSHILHRDIKVHNIFLTSEGLVKLGDFGISKQLDHTSDLAQTWLGTPFYVSPEMLSHSVSSYKSDVWMLGCLLHELCSLEKPFFADNFSAVINKILHENYSPVPEQYSSFIHQLIAVLLDKDADKRPSIDAILQIPEIQEEIEKLKVIYPEVYGLTFSPGLPRTPPLYPTSKVSPHLLAKRWTSESIGSHQIDAVLPRRSENSKGENMNTTWDLCEQGKEDSARKVPIGSQENLKNSMPDLKRKAKNIRDLVEQKKAILSPLNTEKVSSLSNQNSAGQVSNQCFSSMLCTSNQASAGQDSEAPVVHPFRLSNVLSEPSEPTHEDKRQIIRLNNLENIKKQSSVEYGLADKYEEARTKDLPCPIKIMEGSSSKKHHNLSINIPTGSEHGGDSPAQLKTEKAQPAKMKSNVLGDVPTTKVGAKKSFAFSNYLLDQKLPISPNRTFWVTQFLKQKLGEEKFEAVREFLDNSGNATQVLNESSEKVLEIIGEDKKDCLIMLSFLISHHTNSVTPTGEAKVRTHRSLFDNGRPFKGFKSPASANPFLKNIFTNNNDPNSADRVNAQSKI